LGEVKVEILRGKTALRMTEFGNLPPEMLMRLFCFVDEGHFGFFVEHQGPHEAIGGAGARDVHADGQNSGNAALEIGDIGGGSSYFSRRPQ